MQSDTVEKFVPSALRAHVGRIECLPEVESTNRYLLDAGPPDAGQAWIAIAEYQHGGRGRRGRRWIMPRGTGLALSAAWRFAGTPQALTTLSLAAGAAARRAIQDVTGLAVGLKWPNDLWFEGGKLGGILVEVDPLPDGSNLVVAGIGINVDLSRADPAELPGLPAEVRDLAGATGKPAPAHSQLAGALIARLAELFAGFADSGFEPYRGEWSAAHVLDGQPVELRTSASVARGTVRGIESDGALIVEDDSGRRHRHISGDVSIRAGR